MAELTNLPRVDPAPVEYLELANEFLRWLANTVDQLNASWQQLDDILHVGQSDDVGGLGTTVTVAVAGLAVTDFVTARVASSTNPNITVLTTAITVPDQFTATLSADPGASCFINYTALVATV